MIMNVLGGEVNKRDCVLEESYSLNTIPHEVLPMTSGLSYDQCSQKMQLICARFIHGVEGGGIKIN